MGTDSVLRLQKVMTCRGSTDTETRQESGYRNKRQSEVPQNEREKRSKSLIWFTTEVFCQKSYVDVSSSRSWSTQWYH